MSMEREELQMPIGRHYRKGILISEEYVDLDGWDRQTRLDELAEREDARGKRAEISLTVHAGKELPSSGNAR